MKPYSVTCAVISILVAVLTLSCVAQSEQQRNTNVVSTSNREPAALPVSDATLRSQVETFAEGEGNDASWQKLNARPREELINDLIHLRQSVAENDPMQVKIAFVLCYLDYDYAANKAIIISALSKSSPYEGLYGDDVVVLIGRLIRRGDASLLPVVFAATPWSDGALSEGLAVIIAEEAHNHPAVFLSQLKDEPVAVRNEVYVFIAYAMSDNNKRSLRQNLLATSPSSELKTVTNELLAALTKKHR